MIEFSPYTSPSQAQIRKIILIFVQNPCLTLELYQEFMKARKNGELKLGQASSFIDFLLCCIQQGDKLLESLKDRFPRDLYGACGETVKNLQKELASFGEPFSDLVAILWILEQKLGERSFSNFWDSLLREHPEMKNFFPEESAAPMLPRIDKIHNVRPPRRRKIAGKKEEAEV